MGKMFQNASSLKPNCPGMIIGRSSVFYADRKSKMGLGSISAIASEKKIFLYFPDMVLC
jgi:hypothetical protein